MLCQGEARRRRSKPPRDRLFDLVMTRFEVMAPYKPALSRISADLCCHPAEAAQLLPLDARLAILDAGRRRRQARWSWRRRSAWRGLPSIYAKVFRVWLDDNSPGLDRTMAALDRKLKAGEDWLAGVESALRKSLPLRLRVHAAWMEAARGWRRGRRSGDRRHIGRDPAGA